jgi:multicomponent Na+:H+ antiporter subunit E
MFENLKANVRVANDVLTPGTRSRPGVIAIPLDCKNDIEITFLANIISLTPGTLSLDVSSDKTCLYIHAMFIDDINVFKKQLKNKFEKPLLEILR